MHVLLQIRRIAYLNELTRCRSSFYPIRIVNQSLRTIHVRLCVIGSLFTMLC